MKSYPARRRMHRASAPTVSGSSQQFNRRSARNFSSQQRLSAVKSTRVERRAYIREKIISDRQGRPHAARGLLAKKRRSGRGEFVRLFSSSGSCYPRFSIAFDSIRRSASRGATAYIYRFKPSLDVMEQMMENDVDGVVDEVTDRGNL